MISIQGLTVQLGGKKKAYVVGAVESGTALHTNLVADAEREDERIIVRVVDAIDFQGE